MSGYNVQNPPNFPANSVTSPFSAIDSLQNDQLYNLQSFQRYYPGCVADPDFDSIPNAGSVFLPESATNPLTPYVIPFDVYWCNPGIQLRIIDANTGAYSLGGGPATGSFQTGALKIYYVKAPSGGFTATDYYDLESWVAGWQLMKGSYGFNQIPVGFMLPSPLLVIPRGCAIVYGYPTAPGDPTDNMGNGTSWFAAYVNQMDFAGAPLVFNVQKLVSEANYTTGQFDVAKFDVSRTVFPKSLRYDYYTSTDDLVFSTLFPEEYNLPASKCPKAPIVVPGINQSVWPVPL